MKTIYAGMIFILCCSTVCAQEYNHLKPKATLAGEQSYILPKTTLVLDIQVVKTKYVAGRLFKAYTDKELDTLVTKYGVDKKIYNKLKAANVEVTEIALAEDSVKISTVPTPDYSKIFYVNPKAKWNKNQTVIFTYSSDGMLSEGESFMEDKTFDLVVKGIGGLASIVGAVFGAKPKAGDRTAIEELDKEALNFRNLDSQSDYQVYKDLKKIYDERYGKAFSKYFYAIKKTVTTVKIFYTPSAESKALVPIFTISDQGEVVLNEAIADELWAKKLAFGKVESNAYSIAFTPTKEQLRDRYLNRSDELHKGFAYNVPAKMELRLYNGKKVIYHDLIKVSQFGVVGFVNTRKEKISFSLDPVTGELKKLGVEGKAATTDQVGNTSAAVVDAAKVIIEDSDAKLQQEVTRLENEKKKRELLKELSNDD
jgi:hypothetical protein